MCVQGVTSEISSWQSIPPSTTWVPGIKLRLLGLVTSAFTCGAFSKALKKSHVVQVGLELSVEEMRLTDSPASASLVSGLQACLFFF